MPVGKCQRTRLTVEGQSIFGGRKFVVRASCIRKNDRNTESNLLFSKLFIPTEKGSKVPPMSHATSCVTIFSAGNVPAATSIGSTSESIKMNLRHRPQQWRCSCAHCVGCGCTYRCYFSRFDLDGDDDGQHRPKV